MEPEPAISIRPAQSRERLALQAVRWRNLPRWAWETESLRVAVTGRREILLGCAWEASFNGLIHSGAAVSQESRLAAEAMQTLIATFQPHPTEPVQWDEWVEATDPKLDWLTAAGFRQEEEMRSYEIRYTPDGGARLQRGNLRAASRGLERELVWTGLDEKALPEVRAATVREGLMTASQFDFQFYRGELDGPRSPVVWVDGRVAGFMILTRREEDPEVLLMVVDPEFRSLGIGGILIQEMFHRRGITPQEVTKVIFCGNPDKNPGSRYLCLRFGGVERQARVRMVLPPLSSPVS